MLSEDLNANFACVKCKYLRCTVTDCIEAWATETKCDCLHFLNSASSRHPFADQLRIQFICSIKIWWPRVPRDMYVWITRFITKPARLFTVCNGFHFDVSFWRVYHIKRQSQSLSIPIRAIITALIGFSTRLELMIYSTFVLFSCVVNFSAFVRHLNWWSGIC